MNSDITIKEINEKYIALAMNKTVMADKNTAEFILYAENWNDFDNDHYILCSVIGDNITFSMANDLEDVNNLVQKLSGDYAHQFFTKDSSGEIQGDIYGKIIKEAQYVCK